MKSRSSYLCSCQLSETLRGGHSRERVGLRVAGGRRAPSLVGELPGAARAWGAGKGLSSGVSGNVSMLCGGD